MAKISERVGGALKPEAYFLKYAFPCAFIGMQRGRFDEATHLRLEKAAVSGKFLSFEELAKYFPPALRRIAALKKKTGHEKWDTALIRDYFWNEHNKIIDARGEGYKTAPPALCELCKVLEGQVISVKDGVAVVRFAGGKRRAVMTKLVGSLKKGDKVMVHYGYAVEKLS
jgi:hypothetical protein